MLALGIDIGTSGVRTAVLDDGTVIAEAKASHKPQKDARIDANLWWDAVQDCLCSQMAALKNAGRNPSDITGIAVDGTSGSMVLTNAALAPVSPALMYNSKGFDAEAAQIAALIDTDHVAKGSNSALARAMRLVSLADETPAHLLHQADFIAAKLLGTVGGSDYNNALKTGFDPQTETWPDWIGDAISPSLLPEVHAPGATLGALDKDIAARFGLPPTVRVHAGTTDSIAAFLAAAPLETGHAVTSLGSTLAIKLLSDVRIDDPSIGLYSHRLGEHWLVGGASNTGGAVLRTYFTYAELAHLSTRINPDRPTGLDYYPLSAPGERFPINDPNLQPRMSPRPDDDAQFMQAIFEGIAAIEAQCYAEIASRGGPAPRVIYTAGGGAQNDVWTALRQRALNVQPTIAQYSEAAVGAARLASGA